MEVIDCHTHVCFAEDEVTKFARNMNVEPSFEGLLNELGKNRISGAFVITENLQDSTPMGLNDVQSLPKNPKISWIAGINPFKAGIKEIVATDKALSDGVFKGLKIYLGYYPFFPHNKIYEKFYMLAQKHNVPVFFHTGDTFGSSHFVKHTHPLNIDELAVKFPDVKIVLCHFGNPWCIDAAEIVYKNQNVFADLSGFCIGNFKAGKSANVLSRRIESSLEYCGYDKLLYGTDWPLAGMRDYFQLIKGVIPRSERKKVFAQNAKKLFNL